MAKYHFEKEDHVFVEIESQDLWLKVQLVMQSPDELNIIESNFELKVDFSMNCKHFKEIIQKICLSSWNNSMKK